MNLVNDFKLLGHRCVAAHKFAIDDAEEAAIEAKIRVQRIGTLPIDHKSKLRALKTSPLKVFAAPTQWARAKTSTIATLTTDILKVVWGRTRKLRCMEVVYGMLYDAAELHPVSVMVWQTLSTARRMLLKDAGIMQEAKEALRQREELEEREFQRQSH